MAGSDRVLLERGNLVVSMGGYWDLATETSPNRTWQLGELIIA